MRRHRITFRHYNLVQEVVVLVLTFAILFLAIWFTLAGMNRKYLDLRLADAAKVHLFLDNHLDDARGNLVQFTQLPEAERSPTVLTLFSEFSDIYRLDERLRVAQIYKAAPDSKVFTGFSFSGGKLAAYVKGLGEPDDFSEIMRGYEDDAPSVYFAIRSAGQLYLGRLNLVYVQGFLTQFSRFSGTPLMLVANDGFVMLSGYPELHIPTFDLRHWAGMPTPGRTLSAAGRRWIPMIADADPIGAKIAILIPTEVLDTQRNALLAFLLTFMVGSVLLVIIKHRRLTRQVLQPVATFAEKMRDLEQGLPPAADPDFNDRFEELAVIQTRFRAMAEAITQREHSLAEASVRAQAASLAKSEFLANMSHEIRTPLNAILGFAQVLDRDPDLNAAQRDSLATIRRSGQHLLTLINDILDMAKVEAGRMTLQAAPFDPARLVTETAAIFRQPARDRGLDLTVAVSVHPRMVVGDEQKLRQVLINLVGNAVKFTVTGSVTLRVEPGAGDGVHFSVIDTGPGIAPAEWARLFKPFSQTASGRQMQGGTGLGLALSSRFVRLMGGELALDSSPGRGSCFTFTLTLPPSAAVEPTANRTQPPIVALEPGQPVCRILIADDLPDNREPLRALLNTLNPQPPVIELKEAADGQEAVAVWEAWQPQLIFMDMRMPLLSGEEAARQIKARMVARPDAVRTLIVALTASAFDEDRDHVLACGCDEFARKPFQAGELFAILERRAGLRFVRGGETPTAEVSLSPTEVASHLAAATAVWRAELRVAVNLGDFDRITVLSAQVHDDDARLSETLAQWAYNYDLESFTRALDEATADD
ncbi:MAG TPA: ATP-binding protein [Lamprocystis sp. (in: g-proteobacteria)]|nr:ATP-binding protein [Lamprocystis sp. (in: g-proteobacteria)]